MNPVVAMVMEYPVTAYRVVQLAAETETLGSVILEARLKKKMSQEAAAALVGTSQNQWSTWERGKIPTVPFMRRISAEFGIPYPYLLELAAAEQEQRAEERERRKDPAPIRKEPGLAIYPADDALQSAIEAMLDAINEQGGSAEAIERARKLFQDNLR